jgi:hypothetical protein
MARPGKATAVRATAVLFAARPLFFQLIYPFENTRVQSRIVCFFHLLHTLAMGNLLYIIAVILVIIWAVSYFGGFYSGGIIHTLLVIAIIAILLRVISGRSAV